MLNLNCTISMFAKLVFFAYSENNMLLSYYDIEKNKDTAILIYKNYGDMLGMDKNVKILLGFDGSDLALDAVKYTASFFPSKQTEVVLFHVNTIFPESIMQLDENKGYQIKQRDIRACMTEQHKKINTSIKKPVLY